MIDDQGRLKLVDPSSFAAGPSSMRCRRAGAIG
jgi:hypothetical protein